MKGQDSWLWPHLKSVLEKHSKVLASWRKQLPTQSGHTKNFENWILVEMVHSLIRAPGKKIVRTNGHFTDKKIRARDVKGLLSSKSKAKHLSADISVKYTEVNRIVNAEIKTGLSKSEIMDDLKIVRYYNSNKQIKIADRSEFGWIILFPENEKARQSTLKTYNKIREKIELTCSDFSLRQEKVTPWLFLCVAVPNATKTGCRS